MLDIRHPLLPEDYVPHFALILPRKYLRIPYIGNHSQKKTFAICQLPQRLQENFHKFSDSVKLFSD